MESKSNQMSLGCFAILHLCWGGAIHFFFMARLFGRLWLPGAGEPLSPAASRRLLLVIVILCIAAGFLSTQKHERNRLCIALNALTPYGIYLVLTTATQSPICLWIAAALHIGVTLFYATILLSAPIHHRKNRALVLEMRFYQLTSAAWLLLRAMLCLLAAAAILSTALGFSVIRPSQPERHIAVAEDPGSIDQWQEQLQGLREDRWAKLTLQERVELMQLVADIETSYLGLPHPLQVNCQDMPPDTMAAYIHDIKSICINRDHLLYDPPEECLNSVLHESYHSAQHYLCAVYRDADVSYRSLVFLRTAKDYINEFEHYSIGDTDYTAYYDQACESDAREYAKTRYAAYQQFFSA